MLGHRPSSGRPSGRTGRAYRRCPGGGPVSSPLWAGCGGWAVHRNGRKAVASRRVPAITSRHLRKPFSLLDATVSPTESSFIVESSLRGCVAAQIEAFDPALEHAHILGELGHLSALGRSIRCMASYGVAREGTEILTKALS